MIYQKLQSVKSKIGKLSKDQTNPFYKSKYFDVNSLIGQLEPLLEESGLILLQPIENGYVVSRIIDVETGDSVESAIQLAGLTDPQKVGSEITYYRRYSLQSLLGLQAEDDDANKASGKVEKKEEKPWLNIKDRSGNVTPEWTKVMENISHFEGMDSLLALKELRKKYAVNKEVAKEFQEALKALA